MAVAEHPAAASSDIGLGVTGVLVADGAPSRTAIIFDDLRMADRKLTVRRKGKRELLAVEIGGATCEALELWLAVRPRRGEALHVRRVRRNRQANGSLPAAQAFAGVAATRM